MLLEAMASGLKVRFPELIYSIDSEESSIRIPAKSDNVGSLEIVDDGDELTIYLGNFTHWHVGWYKEGNSDSDQPSEIVEDVLDYLVDLFDDKIVMWGSHEGGGGSYHLDFAQEEQDAPLSKEKVKKYVWSGLEIS